MNKIQTISYDIMDRLDRMAEISEAEEHLTRRCYTPEHRAVNVLLAGWMRDAGMAVHEDALGNLIGRYEGRSPGAPAIMMGSHVDSVVMAGRYDGPLGILCAIDCVASLNARGIRYDCALEVACFADEEGVRFQSTYLGSRAVAGTFDPALLARQDKDGITLAEALQAYGLDPDRVGEAARRPGELRCYLEVHIEQGPVLEAEDLAVGAVTGIAGAVRMNVMVTGEAGHAGTVPMAGRHDALMAASEMMLALEQIASDAPDTVATMGELDLEPGASNVIPGKVVFSVDLRSAWDDVRVKTLETFKTRLGKIADHRGVRVLIDESHSADGVTSAPWVLDQIEGAMADLGHPQHRLPSGAGHDAAAMSAITDVGMIFVRCEGGRSHCPEEQITREDAIAGAELLLRTVERIGGALN